MTQFPHKQGRSWDGIVPYMEGLEGKFISMDLINAPSLTSKRGRAAPWGTPDPPRLRPHLQPIPGAGNFGNPTCFPGKTGQVLAEPSTPTLAPSAFPLPHAPRMRAEQSPAPKSPNPAKSSRKKFQSEWVTPGYCNGVAKISPSQNQDYLFNANPAIFRPDLFFFSFYFRVV